MLLKDFYHITRFVQTEQLVSVHIRLNPRHEVYKGHFPQKAVVPGVVQIQIIKELFEQAVETQLLLAEVMLAKYPAMIIPETNPDLDVQIKWTADEAGGYQVSASISKDSTIFTKLKAKLS